MPRVPEPDGVRPEDQGFKGVLSYKGSLKSTWAPWDTAQKTRAGRHEFSWKWGTYLLTYRIHLLGRHPDEKFKRLAGVGLAIHSPGGNSAQGGPPSSAALPWSTSVSRYLRWSLNSDPGFGTWRSSQLSLASSLRVWVISCTKSLISFVWLFLREKPP